MVLFKLGFLKKEGYGKSYFEEKAFLVNMTKNVLNENVRGLILS